MSPRYDQIDSPYLRRILQQTAFADRAVVKDLMRLREYLRGGVRGVAEALHFRSLQDRYPREVSELTCELNQQRKEAAEREVWLKAGGRE